MKFAVYGAGAIGGFLGSRLALDGIEVSLIARGPHLEAIQAKGLRVNSKILGDSCAKIPATNDPAEIGQVDAIILGVKSHVISCIVTKLTPLLNPQTIIISTQNGIPWWYFYSFEGPFAGTDLESVDPGGVIASSIDLRRVIGCLAYCSASISSPGIIEHIEGVRFPLGELNGSRSGRIQQLANIFKSAGLRTPIRKDIRHDVWVKILGNAVFNPISVVTRKTLGEMLADPPTRELAQSAMEEIVQIAEGFGIKIRISPESRLKGAGQVGDHKTSMLQDIEAGRTTEIETLVGAVLELADKIHISTPKMRDLYHRAQLASLACKSVK